MHAFLLSALLFASGWSDETAKWRAEYETALKAPGGWLSVAGLTWLHEGANTVGSSASCDVVLPKSTPPRAGVIRLHGHSAVWEPASGAKQTLKPDDPGPPDVVNIGRVSLSVIKRGGKMGVRVRDPEAATRRDFSGTQWFPLAESWRLKARWTVYAQPKQILITNILGMKDAEPSPGYAEFTLKGRVMRLEPVLEDNMLFFMFRDKTSGHETYGAGRFLYADLPHGKEVELDFNRAHNPPCAFTPYATCPLPPRQNTLPIAVEAGEKRPGNHQ